MVARRLVRVNASVMHVLCENNVSLNIMATVTLESLDYTSFEDVFPVLT